MARDSVISRMQATLDSHVASGGVRAGTIDPDGEALRVICQTMRCAIADAIIRRNRLFDKAFRAMVGDGRRPNAATRRAAAADHYVVAEDAVVASLQAALAALPDPEPAVDRPPTGRAGNVVESDDHLFDWGMDEV